MLITAHVCLSLLVVGGAGRDLFRSTPPPPPPLCFFILPSAPGNNIGECLACIIMMGVQPTVTGRRRRDAPDVIEPSAEKTKKKGDTFFHLFLDYFFISFVIYG